MALHLYTALLIAFAIPFVFALALAALVLHFARYSTEQLFYQRDYTVYRLSFGGHRLALEVIAPTSGNSEIGWEFKIEGASATSSGWT